MVRSLPGTERWEAAVLREVTRQLCTHPDHPVQLRSAGTLTRTNQLRIIVDDQREDGRVGRIFAVPDEDGNEGDAVRAAALIVEVVNRLLTPEQRSAAIKDRHRVLWIEPPSQASISDTAVTEFAIPEESTDR